MVMGSWWEDEARSTVQRHGPNGTHRRVPPKDRRLSPARQKLVLKYLPLARAWARPFKREWAHSSDDFDSAAMLALVESAASYNPTRGVTFSVFAQSRIRGALLDLQSNLRHAHHLNGSRECRLVALREQEYSPFSQTILSTPDEPVGQRFEAEEFLERWLRRLPPRHAMAFEEIYIKGKTQGEAAEALGCSKSKLSVLHKEGIDLIRDSCETREEILERRTGRRID